MRPKIVYSPSCLAYSAPGHPESPERIAAAHAHLENNYDFVAAEPATEPQVLKVHTAEHLKSLQTGRFLDPDCPKYEGIYDHALMSAGAAIQAANVGGFSLMRPPGHHASRDRVSGFCYLNNLAIAVAHLNVKTLIVDIDGHHGDGTEAIFMGEPDLMFLSLHSSPNYPGTGLYSQENCHNVPLPFDCGEEIFMRALDKALSAMDLAAVEQLAISAGFDAFHSDPLASLGLNTDSFRKIGERLAELHLPSFAVLEGGYDAANLGPNISAFLSGLYQQSGSVT